VALDAVGAGIPTAGATSALRITARRLSHSGRSVDTTKKAARATVTVCAKTSQSRCMRGGAERLSDSGSCVIANLVTENPPVGAANDERWVQEDGAEGEEARAGLI